MPSKDAKKGAGGAGEPKKHAATRRSEGGSVRTDRHSKVSGGGGEQDSHHTHAPSLKGGKRD